MRPPLLAAGRRWCSAICFASRVDFCARGEGRVDWCVHGGDTPQDAVGRVLKAIPHLTDPEVRLLVSDHFNRGFTGSLEEAWRYAERHPSPVRTLSELLRADGARAADLLQRKGCRPSLDAMRRMTKAHLAEHGVEGTITLLTDMRKRGWGVDGRCVLEVANHCISTGNWEETKGRMEKLGLLEGLPPKHRDALQYKEISSISSREELRRAVHRVAGNRELTAALLTSAIRLVCLKEGKEAMSALTTPGQNHHLLYAVLLIKCEDTSNAPAAISTAIRSVGRASLTKGVAFLMSHTERPGDAFWTMHEHLARNYMYGELEQDLVARRLKSILQQSETEKRATTKMAIMMHRLKAVTKDIRSPVRAGSDLNEARGLLYDISARLLPPTSQEIGKESTSLLVGCLDAVDSIYYADIAKFNEQGFVITTKVAEVLQSRVGSLDLFDTCTALRSCVLWYQSKEAIRSFVAALLQRAANLVHTVPPSSLALAVAALYRAHTYILRKEGVQMLLDRFAANVIDTLKDKLGEVSSEVLVKCLKGLGQLTHDIPEKSRLMLHQVGGDNQTFLLLSHLDAATTLVALQALHLIARPHPQSAEHTGPAGRMISRVLKALESEATTKGLGTSRLGALNPRELSQLAVVVSHTKAPCPLVRSIAAATIATLDKFAVTHLTLIVSSIAQAARPPRRGGVTIHLPMQYLFTPTDPPPPAPPDHHLRGTLVSLLNALQASPRLRAIVPEVFQLLAATHLTSPFTPDEATRLNFPRLSELFAETALKTCTLRLVKLLDALSVLEPVNAQHKTLVLAAEEALLQRLQRTTVEPAVVGWVLLAFARCRRIPSPDLIDAAFHQLHTPSKVPLQVDPNAMVKIAAAMVTFAVVQPKVHGTQLGHRVEEWLRDLHHERLEDMSIDSMAAAVAVWGLLGTHLAAERQEAQPQIPDEFLAALVRRLTDLLEGMNVHCANPCRTVTHLLWGLGQLKQDLSVVMPCVEAMVEWHAISFTGYEAGVVLWGLGDHPSAAKIACALSNNISLPESPDVAALIVQQAMAIARVSGRLTNPALEELFITLSSSFSSPFIVAGCVAASTIPVSRTMVSSLSAKAIDSPAAIPLNDLVWTAWALSFAPSTAPTTHFYAAVANRIINESPHIEGSLLVLLIIAMVRVQYSGHLFWIRVKSMLSAVLQTMSSIHVDLIAKAVARLKRPEPQILELVTQSRSWDITRKGKQLDALSREVGLFLIEPEQAFVPTLDFTAFFFNTYNVYRRDILRLLDRTVLFHTVVE